MAIPPIRVALALSVIVHLAILLWSPRILPPLLHGPERGKADRTLVVELAPTEHQSEAAPPSPPASQARRARPAPAPKRVSAKTVVAPLTPPPVVAAQPAPVRESSPARMAVIAPSAIAVPEPAPPVPVRAPVALPPPTLAAAPPTAAPVAPPVAEPQPAAATPPAPTQGQGDLSSYIEARRRARGEVTAALPQDRPAQGTAPGTPRSEDERQRRDRIVAENLGLQGSPSVGFDPKGGGGIFEIEYVGRDSAAFIFFGWNKDIRRNSKQLIEVAKGDTDIRTAVVRKMISIIRSEVTGDFTWLSHRLRQTFVLSARAEDNAELEDFMMREFFTDPRRLN